MMDNFEHALSFVLAREGGRVDDPTDHGGRTNMGITQSTYNQYRSHMQLPPRDVWDMLENEASAIYRSMFWQPSHCDEMPSPVDAVVFDSAVQLGVRKALQFLQRALMVDDDGVLGPNTVDALKALCQAQDGADRLAAHIIRERYQFYTDIVAHDPTQQRFIHGWENRLADLTLAIAIPSTKSEVQA